MALVAYDNSDSSSNEEEDNDTTVIKPRSITEESLKATMNLNTSTQETVDEETSQNLFNHLPQPTNKKPVVVEEDDEFLHKKEKITNVGKPKAKITVPSLDDFKDVDVIAPSAKPKAANGKKSGLLSILPQPKNATFTTKSTTKSLIPHVLTKKPVETVKKKEPLPSPLKKPKTDIKLLDYSDESDDEGEVQNDYFSIKKPVELPEDIPLNIDHEPMEKINNVKTSINQSQTTNIQSYFKQNVVDNVELQSDHLNVEYGNEELYTSSCSNEEAQNNSNTEIVLDKEAILKLCGARGKRKREDIQIVDVNQQEVLADAREWLLKGLMDDTSKRVSSSKKRGNEPTSQQRRKHQITYLAHQAKANEAELQNQWANNRMSKRQTQSKYGF